MFAIALQITVPDTCLLSRAGVPCRTPAGYSGICGALHSCEVDKIPCSTISKDFPCRNGAGKSGVCSLIGAVPFCIPVETGACAAFGNLCISNAKSGICGPNLTCIVDTSSCTTNSGPCTSMGRSGFCEGSQTLFFCNIIVDSGCLLAAQGDSCVAGGNSGRCIGANISCVVDSQPCSLQYVSGQTCSTQGSDGVCAGSGLHTHCLQVLNANCSAQGAFCIFQNKSGSCNALLQCSLDPKPCDSAEQLECTTPVGSGACAGSPTAFFCKTYIETQCSKPDDACVTKSLSGRCSSTLQCLTDSEPCKSPSQQTRCKSGKFGGICAGSSSLFWCETEMCGGAPDGSACSKFGVDVGKCIGQVCQTTSCTRSGTACATAAGTPGVCKSLNSTAVCTSPTVLEGMPCFDGAVGVWISGSCFQLYSQADCASFCAKCAQSSVSNFFSCAIPKNPQCFGTTERLCQTAVQSLCVAADAQEKCKMTLGECRQFCKASCVQLGQDYVCAKTQCADAVVSDLQLLCSPKGNTSLSFQSVAECSLVCNSCKQTTLLYSTNGSTLPRLVCTQELVIPTQTCARGWCAGAKCSAGGDCIVGIGNSLQAQTQCSLNCFNESCQYKVFQVLGDGSEAVPQLQQPGFYCDLNINAKNLTFLKTPQLVNGEYFQFCDGFSTLSDGSCAQFSLQSLCEQSCVPSSCLLKNSAVSAKYFIATQRFAVSVTSNVYVCQSAEQSFDKQFRFGPAPKPNYMHTIIAVCGGVVALVALGVAVLLLIRSVKFRKLTQKSVTAPAMKSP